MLVKVCLHRCNDNQTSDYMYMSTEVKNLTDTVITLKTVNRAEKQIQFHIKFKCILQVWF